jgi:hypothetical protein
MGGKTVLSSERIQSYLIGLKQRQIDFIRENPHINMHIIIRDNIDKFIEKINEERGKKGK